MFIESCSSLLCFLFNRSEGKKFPLTLKIFSPTGLYEAVYLKRVKVKNVKRAEALDAAEATLDRAGYEVSKRCTARTSCLRTSVMFL